jgi:hypothetical protein
MNVVEKSMTMNKEKFIELMRQYGDAYVTYVSPNSRKEKFNVGTLELEDNPYIESKPMTLPVDPEKVIMFCWDTDSYRQIDPSTVIRVDSLSAELEKARVRNVRRNNDRNSVRNR